MRVNSISPTSYLLQLIVAYGILEYLLPQLAKLSWEVEVTMQKTFFLFFFLKLVCFERFTLWCECVGRGNFEVCGQKKSLHTLVYALFPVTL